MATNYINPWFERLEEPDELIYLLNMHEQVRERGIVSKAHTAEFMTRKWGRERFLYRTWVWVFAADVWIAASYYGTHQRLGHIRQVIVDPQGQPHLIIDEKEISICKRNIKYIRHMVELEAAGKIPGLPEGIIRSD